MRDDRTNQLLTTLKGEVDKLADSEQWKHWLASVNKFRRYSFGNQLLIAVQRPDATKVAGYKTWQSLGRQVRKGETGISILAPMVKKVTDEEGEEAKRCIGFRPVAVFDVGQTDGEPLPELTVPTVTFDDDGELYARLQGVAENNGLAVLKVEKSQDGERGWYSQADKAITIVDEFPMASQTRTMLHELGHHYTPDLSKLSRPERELIAESAAFVVGSQLGIDTSEYSAFYTANWAAGDSDRIEKVAGAVLKTVDGLAGAIGLEVE